MTKEEITNRLTPLLQGFSVTPVSIETSTDLRNDIGMESLDFIDLMLQCETMFNISIAPEELQAIHTYDELLNLISQKVQ